MLGLFQVRSFDMAKRILKISLYSAVIIVAGAPVGAAVWVGLALVGF